MVWGTWWTYREEMVNSDPDELGVYELADESKGTVYYGSGKLKSRLLDQLNKKECPMARYYRLEKFSTEEKCGEREKELLDAYKLEHGKLPMYNEKTV